MDREAWHAAVYGVMKSRTWLSNWTDWDTNDCNWSKLDWSEYFWILKTESENHILSSWPVKMRVQEQIVCICLVLWRKPGCSEQQWGRMTEAEMRYVDSIFFCMILGLPTFLTHYLCSYLSLEIKWFKEVIRSIGKT